MTARTQRLVIAAASLAALSGAAFAGTIDVPAISYIGQHIIPTGAQYGGTTVGGLSGIDFDPRDGSFWAISDDRSSLNSARFYNLDFNFDNTSVSGVTFNSVTNLQRPDGTNFPINQVDPEAIRFDASTGKFLWSSEGDRLPPGNLQNPFVREMNQDGSYTREFSTPSRYNPTAGNFGIVRNLAFESLTISTDGNTVYTATENALLQDGPQAGVGIGSPSRVLSFNKATGAAGAEFVYLTDPVAVDPIPAGSFATNGLVELLAISPTEFLAVERSFSTGVGNVIKIYKASIAGATDVSGSDTLPGSYTAMTKELLFNLDSLGILLDNIEGISLGPVLPNGNRSLVLVSDNNFSSTQFTQFLAFEIVPTPGTIVLAGIGALAAARRRRA
jgi:hypothetical protein